MSFFKGVFILPDFRTDYFWNTNLVVNLSKPIAAILGVLSIIVLPPLLFFKNRVVLFYIYLGIITISILFLITQISAPRYFGINYILIISGLWINEYYPFVKNKLNSSIPISILEKGKKVILYSILSIHFVVGGIAYAMDFKKPFSNSKQVVSFLENQGLQNKVIATVACDGTALSSYLQRPIFFTSSNTYQSYCVLGSFVGAILKTQEEPQLNP